MLKSNLIFKMMSLKSNKIFRRIVSYRPDRFIKGIIANFTATRRYSLAKKNNPNILQKNNQLSERGFLKFDKIIDETKLKKLTKINNLFQKNEGCISYSMGKYTNGITKDADATYIKNEFIITQNTDIDKILKNLFD